LWEENPTKKSKRIHSELLMGNHWKLPQVGISEAGGGKELGKVERNRSIPGSRAKLRIIGRKSDEREKVQLAGRSRSTRSLAGVGKH